MSVNCQHSDDNHGTRPYYQKKKSWHSAPTSNGMNLAGFQGKKLKPALSICIQINAQRNTNKLRSLSFTKKWEEVEKIKLIFKI